MVAKCNRIRSSSICFKKQQEFGQKNQKLLGINSAVKKDLWFKIFPEEQKKVKS